LTSILNNPIAKTIIGAGAGALVNKILKPSTTGGASSGTGIKGKTQPNLPSMGGGQGVKPPSKPATSKTSGSTTSPTMTDEEIQAELDSNT
jgi:hypothetical protein